MVHRKQRLLLTDNRRWKAADFSLPNETSVCFETLCRGERSARRMPIEADADDAFNFRKSLIGRSETPARVERQLRLVVEGETGRHVCDMGLWSKTLRGGGV